jgi:hypothetical protein
MAVVRAVPDAFCTRIQNGKFVRVDCVTPDLDPASTHAIEPTIARRIKGFRRDADNYGSRDYRASAEATRSWSGIATRGLHARLEHQPR